VVAGRARAAIAPGGMMSGMADDERAEVMVRMTVGPNHGIAFSPDGALVAGCSGQAR
jgi:hypothetical protein